MSKEVAVWLIVCIAITIGIVSGWKLGPDNPIEELAEIIIKENTGLNVDLSPNTPER